MAKLIIIEDDIKLGQLVKSYLEKYGHEVTHAEKPSLGFNYLENESFELLILDIMLPEMDGFQVLKELRKKSELPVIMLTARGEVSDRIVGLELGADDYLPKPFEPRELLARVESILRRSKASAVVEEEKSEFIVGDLVVNFDRREAFFKKLNLDLTTMEFELLSLFIKERGKVLSRDDIMNALQGIDSNIFSRSIDISVSRLRQKLGDDSKDAKYIKTIWGKGYMFIGADE
jgi:DNA-binding response OmpR family regulator